MVGDAVMAGSCSLGLIGDMSGVAVNLDSWKIMMYLGNCWTRGNSVVGSCHGVGRTVLFCGEILDGGDTEATMLIGSPLTFPRYLVQLQIHNQQFIRLI